MSQASYKIIYEGKDVTRALAPVVTRLVYVDKTAGEADELNISVKNTNLEWFDEWNPQKGDTISVEITDSEGIVLNCGTFQVDELEGGGSADSGHTVDVKALSAGVLAHVRTKTSFAHEGKTLKQVANAIADKYHYKFKGITKDFKIGRVTQWHETDLGFLQRVAEDFGYLFALKGETLVFTYMPELHKQKSAITIRRTEITGNYRIVDKVAGIYVKGRNRFMNPKYKKLHNAEVSSATAPGVDTMELRSPVDSEDTNMYKVQGRLYKKNLGQVELSINGVKGSCRLMAGANADIEGWKKYDSKYLIGQTTHTITPEGSHSVDVVVKKVVPITSGGVDRVNDVDTSSFGAPPKHVYPLQMIYNELTAIINESGANVTAEILNRHNVAIQSNLVKLRSVGSTNVAADVSGQWDAINTNSGVLPLVKLAMVSALQEYIFEQYLKDYNY